VLAQEPCAEWLKSGDADKAGRAVGGLAAAVMIQPSKNMFLFTGIKRTLD
jgi:hypothetical protein